MPRIQVLDTTLRDGSYAINFQFTASDTAVLCQSLESAGVDLIEIGHGVGLGASENGFGEAAETDVAYAEAAGSALQKSRFGMFCIPGIARLDHLEAAVKAGMGFVRVGTDVTDVAESAPFIERARELGLFVSANFMKSYACSPREFARLARQTQAYGSEVLAVVDSAGGMLPGDVRAYFDAVRDECDIPLAFHGHNNLGLAVSNSLLAAECGATIIDGSLQGLGRSAGNAPTELLVGACERSGFSTGIELLPLLDVGAKYVKPLVRRQGWNSLDVVAGYAQFHSSYMKVIRRFSSQYRIDPRELILALTAVDRVNAPAELVERLAREIRSRQSEDVFSARFDLDAYFGSEQERDSGSSRAA